MAGYVVVAAAVVLQLCLGGIYAWSAFAPALQKSLGFSAAQIQLVYGSFIFVNTFTMIFTGRLQDRLGPRKLSVASGVLLGLSYLIAWKWGHTFWVLYVSISVIGGISNSCGYISALATSAKWFPKHRGLVCGLAVAGYGGGAILLSNIAQPLLSRGWFVLDIFGLVGVIYGPVILLMGLLMVLPSHAKTASAQHFRRRTLAKDLRFWPMALGMFCCTLPGLTIMGSLKNIAGQHGIASVSIAAISLFAVGSASGRVIWGFFYDRLGGKRSIILCYCVTGLSPLLILLGWHTSWSFLAVSLLVGFFYGSCFPIYSAEVAHLYGVTVMGSVYPFALFCHGIAGLCGPYLMGKVYDQTSNYTGGLIGLMAVVGLGLLANLYLFSKAEKLHATESK